MSSDGDWLEKGRIYVSLHDCAKGKGAFISIRKLSIRESHFGEAEASWRTVLINVVVARVGVRSRR